MRTFFIAFFLPSVSPIFTEILEGSSQYSCSKCCNLRDAERRLAIGRLPTVLCVHLLRFVYDFKNNNKKKLCNIVSFPRYLDMSMYTNPPSVPVSLLFLKKYKCMVYL